MKKRILKIIIFYALLSTGFYYLSYYFKGDLDSFDRTKEIYGGMVKALGPVFIPLIVILLVKEHKDKSV